MLSKFSSEDLDYCLSKKMGKELNAIVLLPNFIQIDN